MTSPSWSKSFEFDREQFSGRLPLFPLPRSVLLPGGLLPLHVFEPRYRKLVEDALAGERLLGLALLKPGYEASYHAAPDIEPWVGIGRLLAEERLDDGRYNVLVLGVARGRVTEEDRTGPYRIASVELPPECRASNEQVQTWRGQLLSALDTVPSRLVRDPGRLDQVRATLGAHVAADRIGGLVDLAGGSLHLGVGERQRLLAAAGPGERIQALEAIALARCAELQGMRGVRPWNLEFSRN